MSKQMGVIKLKGTIGGISFYQSSGEHLARMANGPDASRIANDAAFQRTRENNAEFGGAATAAKSLRVGLASVIQNVADSRVSSRLTQLFKAINAKGTGLRGQRLISLSANKALLTNFEFDNGLSFGSVFRAPFTASNPANRQSATLAAVAFNPMDYITIPSGATHFRLSHSIAVVSDYAYDASTHEYAPTDPTLNLLSNVAYSPVTPIFTGATPMFSIVATLPGPPTMTATASVVECAGIDFFQRVGTQDYLLAQGSAMKVIKVF